ncbi:MAG: GFA family protein, partial [Gammaproteobacteria bacterium]|nr:GFA family protein [Gammaproteobacteria bacterium]NIN39542.1 GFA family protein [Gammaproteobacteria bacterium]NIO25099.1 GFA family protein [Gammaproteobacteria bacterium]NIO65728.1 GFA family protein [Gammaproteobacteria bacterium]NIP64617.1 GFA family protein [Gammaproteobacteria bacterium]
VKPGTLDDTRWLEPDMHIWTCSKQPWVIIPEGAERHEKNPT